MECGFHCLNDLVGSDSDSGSGSGSDSGSDSDSDSDSDSGCISHHCICSGEIVALYNYNHYDFFKH